jgi:hypothetical protein
MLGIMHQAEPRGYLLVKGEPPTVAELAVLCRASQKTTKRCLNELQTASVVSLDDRGVMYSRRMVADTDKTLKGKEYGKLGGNPKLRVIDNPRVNPQGYPEGLTKILDTRSQISSSFIEGKPIDDLKPADKKLCEAAEEKLRKTYGPPAQSKTRLDAFRNELAEVLGDYAPPIEASFAPIAKLIVDGFHPITDIKRPARDQILPQIRKGTTITSWNYFVSALSNKSGDRAAS